MSLNITQTEINTLWDKGYRPFEIYTSNPEPVMYHGKMEETNAVGGWDIANVFATRDEIENYPNFDCIIACNSVSCCDEVFHGKDVSEDKRVDALVVELTKHYMEMIELIKEAKAMPDSDKQKSVLIMVRTRLKDNIAKELKKLVDEEKSEVA